ncbi:MAG: YidC/Oxa1 family membrane protein insertase [Clostridia bacterium]|nr:YidC/Oxa1 family membrane protein insertase [Clostridia bacterium]
MNYIYQAIGTVLSWFDSFLGSYLLAIILFAIVIKLLMLPLSIKQQKNMQKQATLRPKEMAIRKKYKGQENDRDAMLRMQNEMQDMYRANNYNQFAGCLPMLIQFPVIIIIYNAITQPLSYICRFSAEVLTNIKTFIGANYELFNLAASTVDDKGIYTGSELQIASILNNSEWFNTIAAEVTEIAGTTVPNFSLWGINLGEIPSFTSWLILVPILSFAVQFGSMKLTRMMSYQPMEMQNQGCANWMMDIMMPLMTTVIAFRVPALLGIYWIFQGIIGVVQQFILKKIFPMPTFTEEDYKEAERAMRGKGTASRNYDTGKKYRSLHNIDADDE